MKSACGSTSARWNSYWQWSAPGADYVVKLDQLIERLCDAGIDFVIVGGVAGVLHGSSLVTRDLDICLVLDTHSVARLREVLADLHPLHRPASRGLSFLDNPEIGAPLKNLYLATDLGPIDLLGSVTGLGSYAQVRDVSVEIEIFGRQCRVLTIDALIEAKLALGREKDLLAVKELRAIRDKGRK